MGIKFKAPKINKEEIEAFFNTTFVVTLLLTAGLSALNLRGNLPLDQPVKTILGTILAVAVVLSTILIVNTAVKKVNK